MSGNKIPLTISIQAETSPSVAAAIQKMEQQAAAVNTRQSIARREALSVLRGQVAAVNQLSEAQAQAVKALPKTGPLGFWGSTKAEFKSGLAGSLTAGFAGGLAANGILSAASAITSALTDVSRGLGEVARDAIAFADTLNDIADQMGGKAGDSFRIQLGASMAGVPAKSVFGGLQNIGSIIGAAQSGDADAIALLKNYGITNLTGATPLSVAQSVNSSLGSGGVTSRDSEALTKLIGGNPARFLAAVRSIPVEDNTFEKSLKDVNRLARATELTDLTQKKREVQALSGAQDAMFPALGHAVFKLQQWLQKPLDFMDARQQINAEAAKEAGETTRRTAGFWNPPDKKKKKPRDYSFLWDSEPALSSLERMGGATSVGGYLVRNAAMTIQRQQLDALRDISERLGSTLYVTVSGLK